MVELIAKYKDIIQFGFTLALVLSAFVSAGIALWACRQLKKQILLQRWASLVHIKYATKAARAEWILKSKALKEEDNELGREYDATVLEMEEEMRLIENKVIELEKQLGF